MEDTHRWSEIIPPQTALTFAAMYDPKDGIITFSGGSLLDVESCDSGYSSSSATTSSKYSQDSYAPREAYDDQSQVLTIDRFAYALGTMPDSVSLTLDQSTGIPVTFVCEATESGTGSVAFGPYGHRAGKSRPQAIRVERPQGRLRVVNGEESPHSSGDATAGHGTENSDQPQIEWSHLRDIGSKLLSAARTPFDGRMFRLRRCASSDLDDHHAERDDERFFEDACLTGTSFYTAPLLVNLNLKSTFSVTTASTSPFVHVSTPSVGPSTQLPYSRSCPATPSPDAGLDSTSLRFPPTRNEAHDGSDTWRTPTLDAFEFLEGISPNSPHEFRRRLKKLRRCPPAHARTSPTHSNSDESTIHEPASPEEVLARHEYNHVSSPSPRPHPAPQLRRQKSFAQVRKSVVEKLTRLVPSSSDSDGEMWVWVEVTHKVTQHVLSVPPMS